MAGTRRIIYSTVFLPVTALLMILHRGGEGATDDVGYLGCYNLTDITLLSIVAVPNYQNENLTVVLCTQYCDSKVGADALVALSTPSCLCLSTALLFLSERCRLPCPGNESEECGGANGLSTFYSVYNQQSSVEILTTSTNTPIVAIENTYSQSTVSSAMTSQWAGDSGANTWTQTPQTTAGTGASPRNIVISVVLIVILIIIAVILTAWNYYRRRKQSHSLQDNTPSDHSAHESTFRVMPAWEDAVSNSTITGGKRGSTTQYKIEMHSCTPDLLADTSANGNHQRNTYGRLQNDTLTSETTTLETDVDENKMSYEFDNHALDINLDEILNSAPFKSTICGNDGGTKDSSLQDENNLITSTSNVSLSSLDKTGSTALVNVSDSAESVCSNPYEGNTTAGQPCVALKFDDRLSGVEEDNVLDGKYRDVDYRTISSRLISPEMDFEGTCDVEDRDSPIKEKSKVLVDLKTGLDDGIQISEISNIQSETIGTLRNSLMSVDNTDSSLNLHSGERECHKCLSEDEAHTSMREAPLRSTDKTNLVFDDDNKFPISTDSPSNNGLDSWKSHTGNSLCDENPGGIENQCETNLHLPMAVLNTETDLNDSISTGEKEECTSTNGTDPLSDLSGNGEGRSQFASNGNQIIESIRNSKAPSISIDGEIFHPSIGSCEAHSGSPLPHYFEESTLTGGESLSLNASADSENSSQIRPNENPQNVNTSNLALDLSEGESGNTSYDEKEKHGSLTEMPGDPLFDPSQNINRETQANETDETVILHVTQSNASSNELNASEHKPEVTLCQKDKDNPLSANEKLPRVHEYDRSNGSAEDDLQKDTDVIMSMSLLSPSNVVSAIGVDSSETGMGNPPCHGEECSISMGSSDDLSGNSVAEPQFQTQIVDETSSEEENDRDSGSNSARTTREDSISSEVELDEREKIGRNT